MTVRVAALLRGINVGGHKRVEMARLRRLIGDLGYGQVRTHLQSGNAVFDCPAGEVKSVAAHLESAIVAEFGFESQVIVRTAAEIVDAIAADPLLSMVTDPARHFVAFMSAPPASTAASGLARQDFGQDKLEVVGKHLYLWCPDGFSKSPFFKLKFDHLLGVVVTARNWNTVKKLEELTRLSG